MYKYTVVDSMNICGLQDIVPWEIFERFKVGK